MVDVCLALDALLDFLDVDDTHALPPWSVVVRSCETSESTLLAHIRSHCTWSTLVELLDASTDIDPPRRTLALFERLLRASALGGAERVTFDAIERARDCAIRTGSYALASAIIARSRMSSAQLVHSHIVSSRSLPPTAEYISFIASRHPTSLMHANAAGHQCCRLLVAIALHHPAALDWLDAVSVRSSGYSLWWYTRSRLYVVGVHAAVLTYLVEHALRFSNARFVERALAHDQTTRQFCYTRTTASVCPFTSSTLCCQSV